jgi:hypothetical protein
MSIYFIEKEKNYLKDEEENLTGSVIQTADLTTLCRSKIDSITIHDNYSNMFGEWYNNPHLLQEQFKNAKPYPNIVIDNFLSEDLARILAKKFPQVNSDWDYYCNPIEVKYALNKVSKMPEEFGKLFTVLGEPQFLNKMIQLTGMDGLENDPHLHGSGLHSHGRNGYIVFCINKCRHLDCHLDYEIHPISGKERRLNLILFLNEKWEEEWKGDLQLWSPNMQKCEKKVYPIFNRAAFFRTNDNSWHGNIYQLLTLIRSS